MKKKLVLRGKGRTMRKVRDLVRRAHVPNIQKVRKRERFKVGKDENFRGMTSYAFCRKGRTKKDMTLVNRGKGKGRF